MRAPSSSSITFPIASLAHWQPRPDDHILIFAPHPDDETLATGGVIASALTQLPPRQLLAIIATNGDASRLAALTTFWRPPTRARQRDLAPIRQQESLNALKTLGLDENRVQFWGFPDAGLQHIWQRQNETQPYRSGATGFDRAEQARNAPSSPYTASALLTRINETLSAFHPNVIFMPHPQDAHPDHRTLARFILQAVGQNRPVRANAPCQLLAYPMWLNLGLRPRSIRFPGHAFQLPARFADSTPEWVMAPYPEIIRQQRARALRCYQSQAVTVRGLLKASARSTYEAFARVPPHWIETILQSTTS